MTIPTPKPTEPPTGTCDWGHCDRASVDSRWSNENQRWLGVCDRHTDPRVPAAPDKVWLVYQPRRGEPGGYWQPKWYTELADARDNSPDVTIARYRRDDLLGETAKDASTLDEDEIEHWRLIESHECRAAVLASLKRLRARERKLMELAKRHVDACNCDVCWLLRGALGEASSDEAAAKG